MFSRFGSIAAVNRSKKRWDPTEDAEELKILQTHAEIYTFTTLPWTLWIMAFMTLFMAFYLHYFLIYICQPHERGYLVIFLTILLYYVTFFMIYAGWMEYVTIDKKKGIVKYEKVNILKSKIAKSYKIDDLIDMEIVLKGVIRRSADHSRYFIRLKFKGEGNFLEFGECLTIRKAASKFRKCVAILKGVVMPDIIDRGMVTDETIDESAPVLDEIQ